jgi:hypothetical protein
MAVVGNRYAMPTPFKKKADCHLHGGVVIDDQDFRQVPYPQAEWNHQRQVAQSVLKAMPSQASIWSQ